MGVREDINAASGYTGKMPVIITSTSMCDLPGAFVGKYIPILPFNIRTEEGVFKDGVQMDASELIRYMDAGREAVSESPRESDYTEFFSEALKRAHEAIRAAAK